MYLFLLCFLSASQLALSAVTSLSSQELTEVNQRLQDFYSPENNPEVMNRPSLKYDVLSNEPAHPNSILSQPIKNTKHPLIRQSGVKASPRFQKQYCEKFLKKHFPKIQCPSETPKTWATFYNNDFVANLTNTWLEPTYQLDQMPTQGEIRHDACGIPRGGRWGGPQR